MTHPSEKVLKIIDENGEVFFMQAITDAESDAVDAFGENITIIELDLVNPVYIKRCEPM